jgi:sugar phosphate isomerase/epimerase
MTDISRRTVLSAGAALGALAASPAGRAQAAAAAGRLKIGLASYSMRKQSLDQVLEVCKQANIKYLTLKDMHLPLSATPEQLAAAQSKLAAAGVTLAGVGVIYMKKETDIRRAFEYARAARSPLIVGGPEPGLLDQVEKAVKEFNIPLAIHNHGPEEKNFPTPREILAALKNRDRRLGVCMDVGHTVRSGADPVAMVEACGDRLLDLHIKDMKEKKPDSDRVEVGAGVLDIVGLLRALARRRFAGHLALEYEVNPDNPVPGIRESLAYLRGVAATLAA